MGVGEDVPVGTDDETRAEASGRDDVGPAGGRGLVLRLDHHFAHADVNHGAAALFHQCRVVHAQGSARPGRRTRQRDDSCRKRGQRDRTGMSAMGFEYGVHVLPAFNPQASITQPKQVADRRMTHGRLGRSAGRHIGRSATPRHLQS